jgi:hypothetical protein
MAKSVKAKKSALGNGDDLVIAPLRPINPFIAGIGLAAGWSALHVPHLISLTVIATFSVESIAIAVISGGVLAVTMELMFVVANKISSRLKKIIRMVR